MGVGVCEWLGMDVVCVFCMALLVGCLVFIKGFDVLIKVFVFGWV